MCLLGNHSVSSGELMTDRIMIAICALYVACVAGLFSYTAYQEFIHPCVHSEPLGRMYSQCTERAEAAP